MASLTTDSFTTRVWFLCVLTFIGFLEIVSCTREGADRESARTFSPALQDSLRYYEQKAGECRFTDCQAMRYFSGRILSIAERTGSPSSLCSGYITRGTSYIDENIDSSFYYYRKSLSLAEKSGLFSRQAYALYCIGWLNKMVSNYRYAILYLDSSITLAKKENDAVTIYQALTMRGTVLSDMNDSLNAIDSYQRALKTAKDAGLKSWITASSNLIELTLHDTLQKRRAYQKVLAEMSGNYKGQEQEVAGLLNNLSNLYSEADSAMRYLLPAKKLIAGTSDVAMIAGINNSLAYVYLDRGDTERAEVCLLKDAIPLLESVRHDDWLSTLYDSYGDVLKAKGRFQEAIHWKEMSVAAKARADRKAAATQVRLLSSMLDLKNKEREIMVQEEKVRNFRQNLIIAGLVIVALIMLLFWLVQRSRTRLQRERFLSAKKFIELEENEKDRTARDLHDITGQFILNISGEIEKAGFNDDRARENLIDKVEEIGDSLRRISHRLKKSKVEHLGFRELIAGYCSDFSRVSELPIELEFPDEEFILGGETVLHVYRILQELLANASKYAHNGMVMLNFSISGKNLTMTYHDTGPGFDRKGLTGSGMGFQNITERVKLLNGTSELESSPGNGVQWVIEVPLGKSTNRKQG